MADSTQPALVNQQTPQFNTNEILWYDNGIWGDAGYAIPNPMGKTKTNNLVIFNFASTVGKAMFSLMHKRDTVAFTRPPQNKQWLFDLYQMCILGRKRLADNTKMPNDGTGLDVQRAQPPARMFLTWPVPFFGADRIRNEDARYYCETGLLMLSEAMQHEDNEIVGYITQDFGATIGQYLREILAQMAMKFFGFSRADAYKADFVIPPEKFAAYDPSGLMLSTEQTDERPPDQAWPTTNDLSLISGLPINDALLLAKRWPTSASLFSGDPAVWPGGGSGGTDANTNAAGGKDVTGSFISPAGAAP